MKNLITGGVLASALLLGLGTVGCSHSHSTGAKYSDPLITEAPKVKTGLEVLFDSPEYMDLLRGKRVGLITNPTGVDHKMRSTVDLLNNHPEIELVKLFGPEHGVRGDAYAGDKVEDAVDARTGIPELSLYGKTRRPPKEYLEGLDVLVYDIQDIGSRSYTYIYTMAYAMEEAGKAGIPFVVLDRPNPCGPTVSGNILNKAEYSTFVGLYEIPYQYALTPGEAAILFNERFNGNKCELHVVKMEGYTRSMFFADTGLPWVPTSPHIPDAKHAIFYNITGIIGEIPHISIGVGYTTPFELIGAPWIDSYELAAELESRNLPGLRFRPITYKPFYSRFAGEAIQGVHVTITNYRTVQPVEAQIHIIEALQKLYPDSGLFTDDKAKKCLFDEVLGTDSVRERILKGDKAVDIIADYQEAVAKFQAETTFARIYPD